MVSGGDEMGIRVRVEGTVSRLVTAVVVCRKGS